MPSGFRYIRFAITWTQCVACAAEIFGYAIVTPNIRYSCCSKGTAAALHALPDRGLQCFSKLCFLSLIHITSQIRNDSIISSSYRPWFSNFSHRLSRVPESFCTWCMMAWCELRIPENAELVRVVDSLPIIIGKIIILLFACWRSHTVVAHLPIPQNLISLRKSPSKFKPPHLHSRLNLLQHWLKSRLVTLVRGRVDSLTNVRKLKLTTKPRMFILTV